MGIAGGTFLELNAGNLLWDRRGAARSGWILAGPFTKPWPETKNYFAGSIPERIFSFGGKRRPAEKRRHSRPRNIRMDTENFYFTIGRQENWIPASAVGAEKKNSTAGAGWESVR